MYSGGIYRKISCFFDMFERDKNTNQICCVPGNTDGDLKGFLLP